jgi:nucleotide-binding universal stress UspA family protein
MRILLAIDRSPSSDRATQLVATIPWPAGSAIRLVHVAEPWTQSFLAMPGVVVSPETIDRIATASRERNEELLSSGVAGVAGAGRAVDSVPLEGRPASAIANAARDFGADVIVLGSHGRGTLGSALLGSVSSEVVEYATTPVLVARTTSIRRLVLADDGSASAAAARDLVARMPGFRGLAVRVVSVSAGQPSWFGWLEPEASGDIQAFEAVIEADHQRHEEFAAASTAQLLAASLLAEAEAPTGDPGTEIVRVAREFGADLIVMGTRGQTGLERLLLGSVARKVLHHAHCSVLVIRHLPA